MNARVTVTLVLLGLALSAAVARAAEDPPEPRPVTGEYAVVDGLPTLRLWGTASQRGYAQGYLLAKVILGDQGLGMVVGWSPEKYESRLLPLVEGGFVFSESEREELAGMLDGIRARLTPAERRVAALDREITLADLMLLNTVGDWYALGCSSAAVWGSLSPDGSAAVVRNFDFRALDVLVVHQHLKVVLPRPGRKDGEAGRGWVGLAHPGSIGTFTAMSSEGVFLAVHDVWMVPAPKDLRQENVPRLLAVKRLAEGLPAAGAVEEALRRCRAWHTLFGNNFLVATPAPGEGLPAGVVEYDTRETRDRGAALRGPRTPRFPPFPRRRNPEEFVICTNHHRVRGVGFCARYDGMVWGCRERSGRAFDAAGLLALGEKVAVPREGLGLSDSKFGTLHQVVAFTGAKRLLVRLVPDGGNIRDAKAVEVHVTAALELAAGRAEGRSR